MTNLAQQTYADMLATNRVQAAQFAECCGIIDSRYLCDVCGNVIPVRDGILDRCCRIERGDFDLEDRSNDNIKVDLFVCSKCYLEDALLCAFFNSVGRRVR